MAWFPLLQYIVCPTHFFILVFMCIYIVCEVIKGLKKIEYFINNVEHVEEKLHLRKDIKRVKINLFSEEKLKKFVKEIPKYNDIEGIKKLEHETGIILKYYVFYEEYSFYEFSKYGIWPDNSKTYIDSNGRKSVDIKANYLDNFDILVVDKKSGIPREELKWDA